MAKHKINVPFFEIGPKSYLYGDDVLELALAADKASEKYGVDVIFTCPVVEIRRVAEATKHIHVFAPHMDPIPVGRGTADTLAEALVAAGAEGTQLNHVEKPLDFDTLAATIARAKEVGLMTMVCADSMAEASKITALKPTCVVAEPSELIGTGISNGADVYNTIIAGADATGSSSGVAKAADRAAMVDEMIAAVRKAWDERHN